MPRPTLSLETVDEIDELVREISDVPPSALDTEDKIKLILNHTRQLRENQPTGEVRQVRR